MVGLGSYPIVTLAEARAKCVENRRAAEQGRDLRSPDVPTVAEALERVIETREQRWCCPGEWREGTSPSRSLRTVRDSLPSYGSHSPAFFCFGRSVGSSPEGLTSKRP